MVKKIKQASALCAVHHCYAEVVFSDTRPCPAVLTCKPSGVCEAGCLVFLPTAPAVSHRDLQRAEDDRTPKPPGAPPLGSVTRELTEDLGADRVSSKAPPGVGPKADLGLQNGKISSKEPVAVSF